MKRFAFILSLFSRIALADPWSARDTLIESIGAALHLVDWSQTIYSAQHPYKYHELNSVLGEHPSLPGVHTYMAATLIGHILLAIALNRPWRELWQGMWIGMEAVVIQQNFSVGIRLALP